MHDSDQLDSFRYAQMQSSILNKTNSSTSSSKGNRFNLLSKFSALESTLNAVESDLRQLSADTQESLRFSKQISNDLVGKGMDQERAKLNQEIKKLDKSVKYGISESQKRSEKILSDCKARMSSSEALKNTMNSLRMRINRLESTLGFDSITEIIL